MKECCRYLEKDTAKDVGDELQCQHCNARYRVIGFSDIDVIHHDNSNWSSPEAESPISQRLTLQEII